MKDNEKERAKRQQDERAKAYWAPFLFGALLRGQAKAKAKKR